MSEVGLSKYSACLHFWNLGHPANGPYDPWV